MHISRISQVAVLIFVFFTAASAYGQKPMTIVPPGKKVDSLLLQVQAVEKGLEIIANLGEVRTMSRGDIISWVATPDMADVGVSVKTAEALEAEALARQDEQGEIALWVTRRDGTADWVFQRVKTTSRPSLEMPEDLGGISLLAGYRATIQPPGRHGEFRGGISGPDGMEIEYSIWPVRSGPGPRTSGDFISDAERLSEEQRKWYREQYIGRNLVQTALTNEDRLFVSYPRRGINMSVAVSGPEQLADAMLILLSIPNEERSMPWIDAVRLIEQGDVQTVTQYHSGVVRIRMANERTYQTTQPRVDDVFEVLKRCGKYNSVGIITE